MTDLLSFLDAIEADPTDDTPWLVFADWLEEQCEPLAIVVRKTIAAKFNDFRYSWQYQSKELRQTLPRRKSLKLACDCVERVLPLVESNYLGDRTPREYIEL